MEEQNGDKSGPYDNLTFCDLPSQTEPANPRQDVDRVRRNDSANRASQAKVVISLFEPVGVIYEVLQQMIYDFTGYCTVYVECELCGVFQSQL